MIDNWEKPRHSCLRFIMENGGTKAEFKYIPKEEFDQYATEDDFEVGPYKETFGDGYGEPYNPWRQSFGKLKDGTIIFTELYNMEEIKND